MYLSDGTMGFNTQVRQTQSFAVIFKREGERKRAVAEVYWDTSVLSCVCNRLLVMCDVMTVYVSFTASVHWYN